jgi:hypothetical protein
VFEGGKVQALDFAKDVAMSLAIIGAEMPMKSGDHDPYTLHGARRHLQIQGSKVISSQDGSNPWTVVISEGRSVLDGMVSRFPSMNFYGRKRFIEIISVDSIEKGLAIIASLPTLKAFEGIDKVQTVGVALGEKQEMVTGKLALMGVFRVIPIGGMFLRSAFEPYDGVGLPALFTFTSYRRKTDNDLVGQIGSLSGIGFR